jgi:hypothetical protein
LRVGFSATVKGNHSHMVFLDTPLQVDAVIEESKLPWHKYLKRVVQKQPSLQPSHFIVSSCGQQKVVTKLMAGLSI